VPLVVSVPELRPGVVSGQVAAHRCHADGAHAPRHPRPARMRAPTRSVARDAARAGRAPAAGLRRGRGSARVIYRNEKLLWRSPLGICAYYDLAADPGEKHNLSEESRPARRHARAARRLARWPRAARASARAGRRTPTAVLSLARSNAAARRPTGRARAGVAHERRRALASAPGGAQLLVGLPARRETAGRSRARRTIRTLSSRRGRRSAPCASATPRRGGACGRS